MLGWDDLDQLSSERGALGTVTFAMDDASRLEPSWIQVSAVHSDAIRSLAGQVLAQERASGQTTGP